jgi:CHRD domain-containing protein/PEP-CTERM motif-containing protein
MDTISEEVGTMLRLHLSPLFALLMVLLAGTSAHAATILFADLTNAQENPPANPTTSLGAPRPASFGTATFVLNDAMTAMTFSSTVFNIDFTGSQTPDVNDNLTVAHIHAGPNVTPATNGPVVWGFFGTPFNDNNPNDVVVSPFFSGVGGTISGKWDAPEGNNTTLTAQLSNILEGRSYINFHTTQFPGGEVRGAINVVPEPSTFVLLSTGVVALFGLRWLRYRRSQYLLPFARS